MKKVKSVIIGLVVVFLASGPSFGQPQQDQGQPGKYGPKGGIFKELNLTAEQSAKLAQNRQAQRQEMLALRSAMKEKQEKLQQELKNPAATKATVEPLVTEIKSLQAQLIDHRVNGIFAVKEILTPEQFAKFQQLTEKRKGEMKGHFQGWREKRKAMNQG